MFIFGENRDRKRYGRVNRGWHPAKIYQAVLKNNRGNNPRQYISVDFEIIHERQNKDKLVRSFFNYNRNGKPDVSRELMVYVVHRYRNKKRFDRAEDFRPLFGDDNGEDSC
jgi:hypothetical protein